MQRELVACVSGKDLYIIAFASMKHLQCECNVWLVPDVYNSTISTQQPAPHGLLNTCGFSANVHICFSFLQNAT